MQNSTVEALQILAEECGETVVAVSKCMRFGIDQVKYGTDITNRQHLTQEVGDVLAMIEILVERGELDSVEVDAARQRKLEKLKIWSTLWKNTNT